MNPLNHAQTELRLAIERAERRALAFADSPTEEECCPAQYAGRLADHRTEVAGDLADALDRIELGLGARFMQALYPELRLHEDPEWRALLAQQRPVDPSAGPPAAGGDAGPQVSA